MTTRDMNATDHNRDSFPQWIEAHPEPDGPLTMNPRTIKTKTQRDRLVRIEMVLDKLLKLKTETNIVDRGTTYADKI